MKKLLVLSFFAAMAAMTWVSCTKEDTATTNPITDNAKVQVIDGVLTFTDNEIFFKTVEELSKMSEAQLDNWEQQIGFKSYRNEYENFLNATEVAELANDEATYKSLIGENRDILSIENNTVSPKFASNFWKNFINRQGIYKVGNSLLKFENTYVLEAEGGNVNNPNVFLNAIKRVAENLNNQTRANCNNSMSAVKENGSRRTILNIRIRYCAGCCGMTRAFVEFEAKGEKKSVFGGWNSYNTAITIKNGGYGLFNSFGTYVTLDNYSLSTTTDNWFISSGDGLGAAASYTLWIDPQTIASSSTGNLTFDKVKGKATTRGTDDWHWAMICCGYTSGCPDPNNP
jgi:hypothetical protein